MSYTYADNYLAPLVTPGREDRAVADVSDLGALPAAWVARLVVLRVYVLTCQECQKAPDDTFAAKLSTYRKEYASHPRRSASASLKRNEVDLLGRRHRQVIRGAQPRPH